MGMSLKQIRYLYAIGVFKKDLSKKVLQKSRSVTGSSRQITRELGKIGSSLKTGEVSTSHQLRVGNLTYPIQKDRNGSSYPAVKGKTKSLSELPEGPMSVERIKTLGAKRVTKSTPVKVKETVSVKTTPHKVKPLTNVKAFKDNDTRSAENWASNTLGEAVGNGSRTYQSSSGMINSVLRQNDLEAKYQSNPRRPILIEQAKTSIAKLDAEFDSAVGLQSNLLVHRGVSGDFAADLVKRATTGSLVGSTIEDKAFLSTSMIKEQTKYFGGGSGVHLEIEVPAGTKALYLGSQEHEILLPRDSSMVVTKIKQGSKGIVIRLQYQSKVKSVPPVRSDKTGTSKTPGEIAKSLSSIIEDPKFSLSHPSYTANQVIGQAVFKQLGFDKKPEVVDDDKFEGTPGIPLFRGYTDGMFGGTASDHVKQFQTGELHVGRGIAGVGIYTAPSQKIADTYVGKSNGILTALKLKPDARIISLADAKKLEKSVQRSLKDDSVEMTVIAAAAGYDAIDYDGVMHIVMNRGKLLSRKNPVRVVSPKTKGWWE